MKRINVSLLSALSAAGIYSSPVRGQSVGPEGAPAMNGAQLTELAGLMLKMKKLPDARQAAAAALAADPASRDALMIAGRVAMLEGNGQEALEYADKALALMPDDTTARLLKGTALASMHKNDLAAPFFEDVPGEALTAWREEFPLTATPEVLPTGLKAVPVEQESPMDREVEAARTVLAAKDYPQADRLSSELVQKYPENLDAALLRADLLSESKQYMAAISVLQSVKLLYKGSEPFPGDSDLASAMADAGRTADAVALFREIAGNKERPLAERSAAATAAQATLCASLLEDGEKALDKGELKKAEMISSQLVTITPQCPNALTLRARSLKASNKPEEAVRIFSVLKDKADGGKFDPQVDYAASLAAACRYRDAVRAYQEITARPGIYSPEEVKTASEEIRSITDDSGGRLITEYTGASFEEGDVQRAAVSLSLPRMGQTRLLGGILWDQISLKAESFPYGREEDRITAYAGFETKLENGQRFTGLAGSTGDEILGSAAFQWDCREGTCFLLRGAWNDPAHDTLLLEAMDGRQHVLSANLQHKLAPGFYLDATAKGRIVEVDGNRLGTGFKGEAQLRFQPWEKNANLWVAYQAEYSTFSAREDAWRRSVDAFFEDSEGLEARDAVLPKVNRHALQAHVGGDLGKALTLALTGEVAYRQETRGTEFGAIGEAFWHISPSTDFNLRLEYYTTGAGPNSGSSVMMGTAGLKVSW